MSTSRSIKEKCVGKYTAYHYSGRRNLSQIRNVVIHCTEGPTALSAALWFENPASSGSANLVVDDNHCFRTLDDGMIPWAAPPLNTAGLHIELAGFASWTRSEWKLHDRTLRRAAYKTALRCKAYGIPVKFVTAKGLWLRKKGITTHAEVTKAFRKSDHTDPGKNFPMDLFLGYVKEYLDQLP